MAQSKQPCAIPTSLSAKQFDEFVCPFLTTGRRGPKPKVALHTMFNYILRALYLGCPWKELPIAHGQDGEPEIHYTRVYRQFRRWHDDGCFEVIFANTVFALHENDLLDTSIVHGDGTTTAAKKGGDNLGFSGHKHLKGDKVVALCDRHCNILAPFIAAPGNKNESPMLVPALNALTAIAQAIGLPLHGSIVSFDGVYDSKANRKAIFNRGLVPNIPENRRRRMKTKRGRKRLFDPDIFQERFRTIERVFAWEDKFRRLLLRFERISSLHYALKTLAYTMINLRHFCRG
jgi:transposase